MRYFPAFRLLTDTLVQTTIRVLGGLLSAYHLSGEDPLYLEKAVDLADRILPAFNTQSGLPLSSVNLAERVGVPDRDNNGWVSTAEVSTLQLELRYLSVLSENDAYWRAAEKVYSTQTSSSWRAIVFIVDCSRLWMLLSRTMSSHGLRLYS